MALGLRRLKRQWRLSPAPIGVAVTLGLALAGCATTMDAARAPCNLPGATSGGCEAVMAGAGDVEILAGSVEKGELPAVGAEGGDVFADFGGLRGSVGDAQTLGSVADGAPQTLDPMADDFQPVAEEAPEGDQTAAQEAEQIAPDATVSAAVAASDAVVKESTEKAEKTASLADPEPKRHKSSYNSGAPMSLSDAVARAVTLHPRVGINRARADQALYGVDIARAAGMPKVEAKLGAGENTVSTYDHMNDNLFKDGTGLSSIRVDAGLSVRQTLYDFGVIRNDVARSEAVHEAETLKLLDRAEEIALETVNAYLRILEQRELVALADEHVAAHERLAKIVKQNEEDGNSTVADVERIAARLVDVKTERTNLDNDLQAALDRFKRLARTEPGRLSRPAVSLNSMPPTSEAAVDRAVQNNPRLLSLEKAIDALNRELDSQMAKFKPKVEVELEGTTKNYLDTQARTEFDVRGMLVLSHKLYDGGERRGYAEQIQARIDENEMRYTDTRDDVEADLRQNYRSIDSSRRKLKSLREGAASSTKVRELYLEQFKAGERTIFELLDSQSAYYMAKRELINNQFDEMRSVYEILRSMGMLTETITGKPALEL